MQQSNSSFLHTIKESLFREPGHGKRSWLPVLFGSLLIIGGLTSFLGGNLFNRSMFIALGFMGLFLGSAELLPKNWTVLAGMLRVAAYILLLSMAIALLIAVFS